MQTQVQQITEKCKAVFALAEQLYPGIKMDKVGIRFDLKGRAAGMACCRGGHYYMRFNRDMLTREAFDHVLNDTVPHEVAHCVCFMNPKLGRNHDYGWARVCRALGGTGARTHSEEVVYGKGYTYEYTTSNGNTVRLSDSHHKRVQRGETLRYRKNLGNVSLACDYSIVGYQGRTLTNPTVRQGKAVVEKPTPIFNIVRPPAPNSPAAIEDFVRGVKSTEKILRPSDDDYRAAIDAYKNKNKVPAVPVAMVTAPVATAGQSKAAVSRQIMRSGYQRGESYETIIATMMRVNGYPRQLARATFKANAERADIPTTFGS